MTAFLWLVALVLSLISATYLVSVVVASIRARQLVWAGVGAILALALGGVAFGVDWPVVVIVVALAAGFAGVRILRQVTRNPQHATQTTSLSAAHIALLFGSFVFLIPFAWLISTSLKSDDEQSAFPPVWIPTQQVTWQPREFWERSTLRGLGNTGQKPLPVSRLRKDGSTVVEVAELPTGEVKVMPLYGDTLGSDGLVTVKRSELEKVREVGPRWENYQEALEYLPKETNYGLVFLGNTLFLTIMTVIGTLLSSSLVAYSFARLRWPGRDALFVCLLATMMVPGAVTMMPQFLIFRNLGWIDTLKPLWVPAFFGSAFNIFLLRQFFMSIPTELEDAAKIDGCGPFGIYWRVMLPLVKPALAAIAIMATLGAWNNFQGPLIYLSSPEKMPLAYALQLYQQQHSGEPGLLMAASTMVVLPILLLFFFTQRYFIEGVSLTGLGGR
jgi:multiple sugar transport system permease protein